ncbi:unnamed protein product, partial [Rotaria sp. Silwood1]
MIRGDINNNFVTRILERTNVWLLNWLIKPNHKDNLTLWIQLIQKIKENLTNPEERENVMLPVDGENRNLLEEIPTDNESNMTSMAKLELFNKLLERPPVKVLMDSLRNYIFNCNNLKCILKTILTIWNKTDLPDVVEYVKIQMATLPLIECSSRLKYLLEASNLPNVEDTLQILDEYLSYTRTKPLFYRLLLHPGITEKEIEQFMEPICNLAIQVPKIELVVFFDEVNTSSCLGLVKEMFIDKTLHCVNLPENIFFTAAINPPSDPSKEAKSTDNEFYRVDYMVHKLPQSLQNLVVPYGVLESSIMRDYIQQKIAQFEISIEKDEQVISLTKAEQKILTKAILDAQEFCETKLAPNTVSQREIQRCFNFIEYFWSSDWDNTKNIDRTVYALRCIALSIALIYYFRLPKRNDNKESKVKNRPSREDLAKKLHEGTIPNFPNIIETELQKFVNDKNFVIPKGVAINQAIREHVFAIAVSIATRTPVCIIGAPGQSKTLSFQIVLQNLQGPQLSKSDFCKSLPAIDPFFCLGSKHTTSTDISYAFERAIKREQYYQESRTATRCVVFLDEASLPSEKRMVLKVLHQYLDECKVAFVAIANSPFDAANANRMTCIYRSLPSKEDQEILAYGCLGLRKDQTPDDLKNIIAGLCDGYRDLLNYNDFQQIFHDRDFIYMLRELAFKPSFTSTDSDLNKIYITPMNLVTALEDNFNGITSDEFKKLTKIFFHAIENKGPIFEQPTDNRGSNLYRDVTTIMSDSMQLTSVGRRSYGRYKLVIDESDAESVVRFLFQTKVLDPNRTTVFRLSDFPNDVNNELKNVEILSTIKLCMETGRTILMINTRRIHGALYDVFNQNFSIMATGDTRKLFSKVAIGPKTLDVVVHEDFQCVVHINRNEMKEVPAPFLSRFQNIENAAELEEKLLAYKEDQHKCVLIIIINVRFKQQRQNIPFVRQLVDKIDSDYNVTDVTAKSTSKKNVDEASEYTQKEFHNQLTKQIMGDSVLVTIISEYITQNGNVEEENNNEINLDESVIYRYVNDSVQRFCISMENNFSDNMIQSQKAVEFISTLLMHKDNDDLPSFEDCENKYAWLLAYAYTSLEYSRRDLLSLYSACRILDSINQSETPYWNLLSRNELSPSKVRGELCKLMFGQLWEHL